MSIVISIPCTDGFCLGSDAQSVFEDAYGLCKENSPAKITQLGKSNLALAHSGKKSVARDLLFTILQNWLPEDGLTALELIARNGVKLREDRHSPNLAGISEETGFIIAGFVGEEKVSLLVTPNGDVVHTKRFAVMGAGSPYVREWLDSKTANMANVEHAIPVTLEAIRIASRSVYSNEIPLVVIITKSAYVDLSGRILQIWNHSISLFHDKVLDTCLQSIEKEGPYV